MRELYLKLAPGIALVLLGTTFAFQLLLLLGFAGKGTYLCGDSFFCDMPSFSGMQTFAKGIFPPIQSSMLVLGIIACLVCFKPTLFAARVIAICGVIIAVVYHYNIYQSFHAFHPFGLANTLVYCIATAVLATLQTNARPDQLLWAALPIALAYTLGPFSIRPILPVAVEPKRLPRDVLTGSADFKAGFLVIIGSPSQDRTRQVLAQLETSNRRKNRTVVFRYLPTERTTAERADALTIRELIREQRFKDLTSLMSGTRPSLADQVGLAQAIKNASKSIRIADDFLLAKQLGLKKIPYILDCPPSEPCEPLESITN